MSESTVTGLQEKADVEFTKLRVLSGSLKDIRERLQAPIDYKGAMSILEQLGGKRNVKLARTRLRGAECIENSYFCKGLMNFSKDSELAGNFVLRIDDLFLNMGELLAVIIEDTLKNADNDVETFNELRKDIYRLVAISRTWYDTLPMIVTNFKDIVPAENESADYLIDNDLLGTAKNAIKAVLSTCGGAFTDLDTIDLEIDRWQSRFNLLMICARNFIKADNE